MFLDLVTQMRLRGHETQVILLKKKWLWNQLESRGIQPVLIESKNPLDLNFIIKIAKFIKKEKVDLVHSHLLDMNIYSALAAKLAGVPHLATEHGDIHHISKKSWKLIYKMKLLSLLTNKLIAVSKFTADKAEKIAGIKREKIEIIYNGIDIKRFRKHPERSLMRSNIGISKNVPWIINIGNLYPVKGQIHLIRAFAAITKDFPEAVLSIVGRGDMKETLSKEINRLKIEHKVILHGFRHDVIELLSSCDLFVMASLSEGLPLALLEAIASEVPVVASDVGGIGEVIIQGWSGNLTPASDEKALSAALSEALSNPKRSLIMAKNAYQLIGKYFNLNNMIDKYEFVYNFLVKA